MGNVSHLCHLPWWGRPCSRIASSQAHGNRYESVTSGYFLVLVHRWPRHRIEIISVLFFTSIWTITENKKNKTLVNRWISNRCCFDGKIKSFFFFVCLRARTAECPEDVGNCYFGYSMNTGYRISDLGPNYKIPVEQINRHRKRYTSRRSNGRNATFFRLSWFFLLFFFQQMGFNYRFTMISQTYSTVCHSNHNTNNSKINYIVFDTTNVYVV